MYPKWHEQSIQYQKKYAEEIDSLRETQKEIITKLDDAEKKRKKTKRNELRDRLLQIYRYYTSKEKNPYDWHGQRWSRTLSGKCLAIMKKLAEMEDMHTTVQPAMRLLNVIPMHEQDRIAELMQSRK